MKTAREKRVELLNILGITDAQIEEGLSYLNRILEEKRINKREYNMLKSYFVKNNA